MERLILFVFKIWFPHRWHWFSCCVTLFGSSFAQKRDSSLKIQLPGLFSIVCLTTFAEVQVLVLKMSVRLE